MAAKKKSAPKRVPPVPRPKPRSKKKSPMPSSSKSPGAAQIADRQSGYGKQFASTMPRRGQSRSDFINSTLDNVYRGFYSEDEYKRTLGAPGYQKGVEARLGKNWDAYNAAKKTKPKSKPKQRVVNISKRRTKRSK